MAAGSKRLWFRYALRHWLLPQSLLLLIGGLIMGAIFFALQRDEFRFQREGVEAEGTVLAKSRMRAKKSWTNKVVYQYTDPSGKAHQSQDTIPEIPWTGLNKGSRLPILYLTSDPAKSRTNYVSTGQRVLLGYIGVGAGAALAGIGLLAFLFSLRSVSKQVWVVRSGRRTLATVKEFLAEYSVVVYEFRDTAGQAHEGREQAPRGINGARNPGDKLVVLYDPQRPNRHEIDRYAVRAEA